MSFFKGQHIVKKVIIVAGLMVLIMGSAWGILKAKCPPVSYFYPVPDVMPGYGDYDSLFDHLQDWHVLEFCKASYEFNQAGRHHTSPDVLQYVQDFFFELVPYEKFLLAQKTYAQPFPTDLENLQSNFPDFVAPYKIIDLIDAWNEIRGTSLFPVTFAIFDTGVDARNGRHPEFFGVEFGGSSPFSLQDKGPSEDPPQRAGHGTIIAGIIGASNLSSDQILSPDSPQMNGVISGVTDAYTIESRSSPLFLTNSGYSRLVGNLATGTIVNISYLVEPKILSRTPMINFYKQVFGNNSDKLFVIAAGNDNRNAEVNALARTGEGNVVVVGATQLDSSRWNDGPTRGSNFGTLVDIAAPGKGIYGPAIRGAGNFPETGPEQKNYQTEITGTSAAAPFVTGVAGLIKALNPLLSPADIKDILTKPANTDKVTTDPSKPIGRRLNARKAVCDSRTLLNCTSATAVRPGFNMSTLPANDDGSTALVPLGFTVNFFGSTRSAVHVNNNGNLTFDTPLPTFTPSPLSSLEREIIAPYFADVDTRVGNVVTYGQGTVNSRPAFGAHWPDVGCYNQNSSVLNNFQVILIERNDTGTGNFDIEFNYDRIQWETGQASGGNTLCEGGITSRVGFSDGSGAPGTFFELPGSGISSSFLDSNLSTGLIHNSLNSTQTGRYVFPVRGGVFEE